MFPHRQALQGLDNMTQYLLYAWPTHFSYTKSTIKQTDKHLKKKVHEKHKHVGLHDKKSSQKA